MREAETHKFKVHFTLDDDEAQYFRRRYRKAKAVIQSQGAASIIASAREVVRTTRDSSRTPRFVRDAVDTLLDLVRLLEDHDYRVPMRVRNEVLAGLAYFSEPQDLIPDDVPGLGFVDDAIMIQFIAHEFRHELWGHQKFVRECDALHHSPSSARGRALRAERAPDIRRRIRAVVETRQAREAERRDHTSVGW